MSVISDAKAKDKEIDLVARDSAFENSGLDDSFRDQFNATWSAYDPTSIENTFWDNFSNFFGARSSADKMRMELKQRRQQEIANLVGVGREQKFNSESEQVKRMRAAGLNPDLQGLGDASKATESSELDPPDFSGLTTGADVVGTFGNALTSALSLFSGIQSLRSVGVDIANKEIDNAVSGHGRTFELLKSMFTRGMFDDIFNEDGTFPLDFKFKDVSKVMRHQLSELGVRSSRGQRQVIQSFADLIGSYSGDKGRYKNFAEFIDAQDAYASKVGSWYRNNGLSSTDADITSALKDYADALHDLDVKSANYQRTYYSYLKADKIAEAQNAAASFQKYSTDRKMELYRKLMTNSRGKTRSSMFSLLLATQLMGDTNALGQIGGATNTLASPFLGTAEKMAAKALF